MADEGDKEGAWKKIYWRIPGMDMISFAHKKHAHGLIRAPEIVATTVLFY